MFPVPGLYMVWLDGDTLAGRQTVSQTDNYPDISLLSAATMSQMWQVGLSQDMVPDQAVS